MKIFKKTCLLLSFTLLFVGCNDVLDLEPTDRVPVENLFGDPEGTKLYMANLYYQLPIEDFTYFRQGFNYNAGGPNNGGFAPAMVTDEAVHSEFGDWIGNDDYKWWEDAYKLNRDVNLLFQIIPTLEIPEADKNAMLGEASFIRAYNYFALAKRYGGVPIITEPQAFEGNVETIKVPRSTEKETWDFVLAQCDVAINNLGTEGNRRATKWAAYALKSRAALHAASVAKFWNKAPLSGIAVDQKLIGMDASQANVYYQACIEASGAIMNSGQFSLYMPTPANPEVAAENYRAMFENPNNAGTEAILIKGRTLPGERLGHNYDIWYQPAQLANGWPHPGRMNPTLDLVDAYESYANPGQSAPIVTTTDGNTEDYNGYNAGKTYLEFDSPNEIFQGKDARLWATAILPNTVFKNTPIIIQAGYIAPSGQAVIRTNSNITVNGNTYYSYGAANTNQYSGFDTYGGNNTRTGFGFKKFMSQKPIVPGWNQSTSDFMDFRYAEILLNYAEAVVESGAGDPTKAATALNDIRKRAAHTVEIPLTIENVLRERRVELAFENKRFWDLMRRRDYHLEFNNRSKHALLPLLDLRGGSPKYIFVRAVVPNSGSQTFETKLYYRYIPGVGNNGLVQNPQY